MIFHSHVTNYQKETPIYGHVKGYDIEKMRFIKWAVKRAKLWEICEQNIGFSWIFLSTCFIWLVGAWAAPAASHVWLLEAAGWKTTFFTKGFGGWIVAKCSAILCAWHVGKYHTPKCMTNTRTHTQLRQRGWFYWDIFRDILIVTLRTKTNSNPFGIARKSRPNLAKTPAKLQPSRCRNRWDPSAAPLPPFAGAFVPHGKSNLHGMPRHANTSFTIVVHFTFSWRGGWIVLDGIG